MTRGCREAGEVRTASGPTDHDYREPREKAPLGPIAFCQLPTLGVQLRVLSWAVGRAVKTSNGRHSLRISKPSLGMISFLLWDPPPWNTTKRLGPEWVNSRVRAELETAQAAATHLGRQMSVCSGGEQGPSVNVLHMRGRPTTSQGLLSTTTRSTVCQALLGTRTPTESVQVLLWSPYPAQQAVVHGTWGQGLDKAHGRSSRSTDLGGGWNRRGGRPEQVSPTAGDL